MILLDYIVNLSVFSFLVSIPIVIRSFNHHKPFKHHHLWVGVYSGIVTTLLVMLSIKQQGFSYDIRYAPVILVFAYIGPGAGLICGFFTIITRLFAGGNLTIPIIGWSTIMVVFLVIHFYTKHLSAVRRTFVLYCAYLLIYVITVPIVFNVFRDQPFFHFQYLLFVLLGVIIGAFLIESYVNLYRLNARLSDMYKRVEESEFKYRLIAENTSDFITVIDKNYKMSYLSPSHQNVFGQHYEQIDSDQLWKLVHPDDIPKIKDTLMGMFEKKDSESIEFRLQQKDANWIELEARCMPVKGEDDSIEYIVIISRDISERKKAEEILLQSEKLSIVGELAAGVAHEIRNPLTTIKGFVQLYKAENSSHEYNDLLLDELERIENITTEMLSLGKPQAIQLKQTNLRDLVDNTLELLAPQALMNGIQFVPSFQEEAFTITCEKNQLKQVFLNIFKNAMEAMPGGGEIHVTLRKGEENNCILSIQDNGCGIPEELLPRLGEPFYSLKEKGTGLGLMICHKIIRQHHGHIIYRSKVNEGTLVQITLPLVS